MQTIDRNFPRRGLPNQDIYMENGNIHYNATEKAWACAICNLKYRKYDWKQITTHVNSKQSDEEYRKQTF